MKTKSSFFRVLAYTSIESIGYQAILLLHQLLLFRTIPAELYGQIGILFSSVFLGALYVNMGLDISIAPLFKQATSSKHQFKQLIINQIMYTTCIAVFLVLGSAFLFKHLSGYFILFCAPLIITESYKKIAKTVLHLAFAQRVIAITEIATLLGYVAMVWLYIGLGHSPSIAHVFLPMLAISIIASIIYSWHILKLYRSLEEEKGTLSINWKHIIKIRIKNTLFQISRSLYSGNFLIPIVASQYGLELAGLLKLISMSAYSINSIIQHIFGITSDVFFASMKHSALKLKQSLFTKLSTYIYHILFIICMAIFLHHRYIQFLAPNVCHDHLYIIYLFLLVLFSENIALTHEHLFIVEEKATLLIASNLLLLTPLAITQYLGVSCSLIHILLGLLIARALHYIGLSTFTWYTWNMRPKLGIKPLYLCGSAAIAFLCFLFS